MLNDLSNFLIDIIQNTLCCVSVKMGGLEEFKEILKLCDNYGIKAGHGGNPLEDEVVNTYYDCSDGCYAYFFYFEEEDSDVGDFRICACVEDEIWFDDVEFDSLDEFMSEFNDYIS